MSRVGLSLVGLLLLVLDVSLSGLLSLGPVRPSLTLPFVVYVGLRRGPIDGSLCGMAMGLGEDLLGALPLGSTSLAYTVVGFACGKLWQDGPFRLWLPWGVALLFSGFVAQGSANYFLARGTGLEFFPLYLRSGLPAAVYTMMLGLLWFLSPLHRERSL